MHKMYTVASAEFGTLVRSKAFVITLLLMPVIMLVIFPLLTWMPILQNPNTGFARALTFFPPATPMLMMLRVAVPPGPPWWEVVLGAVVAMIFMLLCIWAAGKIFRIGILSHGQTPSLKKLAAWLMSK